MKHVAFAFALGTAMLAGLLAQAPPQKTLDIYVADTEGGKAALFVTPSGETVLIDAGNPGARDHDRIVAMLEHADVKKIDHLVITHYHVDHVGGLVELAKRFPIAHFVDHGPTVEPKEQVQGFQAGKMAGLTAGLDLGSLGLGGPAGGGAPPPTNRAARRGKK